MAKMIDLWIPGNAGLSASCPIAGIAPEGCACAARKADSTAAACRHNAQMPSPVSVRLYVLSVCAVCESACVPLCTCVCECVSVHVYSNVGVRACVCAFVCSVRMKLAIVPYQQTAPTCSLDSPVFATLMASLV